MAEHVLVPGEVVPDFELPVRGTEKVRLATTLGHGPVLLLTYVLDFSPG
jgi:peroxiredoxin